MEKPSDTSSKEREDDDARQAALIGGFRPDSAENLLLTRAFRGGKHKGLNRLLTVVSIIVLVMVLIFLMR